MFNKMIVSFVAVLLGFMSLGFIQANTNDYLPVPKSSDSHVAYIDRIVQENGNYYIDANYIEWYEGEEANKVFLEREPDSGLDAAPDGYYIVNDDAQIRRLEISPNAKVYMQIYNRTGNVEEATTEWNEQISIEKFVSLFADDAEMNMKDYPYHLQVEGDKIVKITQQYIP
ncbi:hypothetical protein D7Z26_00400 [Cohnella endophytica]|uniref:Copper amine oxidase-like N-terminal domain-containing protein n=1 Tax=Cohnella endophytica TaxID=2419778 RepID=A0A494Y8T3_9BACL|nr:hypothetical protein [Cohnella endophytica]RKP58008.1 hypothetical protein D7Z26_00400 [Cohnella endophytica]